MRNSQVQPPVSIDIDDLTEVVGGVAFNVKPLSQSLVASVAYNPDTCPTSPGTPVSTCMCPSSKVSLGNFAVNPAMGR